ncbi:hypothetical protein GIB67_001000, partial [Kingdonia uniflora]
LNLHLSSPSMELQLQLPLISAFILALLVAILNKLGKSSKTHLPPGPWKLPILGSLHHLINGLSHHILRDLAKKHGPLMHLQLGEISAIVISSPEMAKEVMKTQELMFVGRPVYYVPQIIYYDCTDIVFAPYGNYWRQLRKICISELLSAKRVQSFRSLREEEVSNFIGNILLSISEAGVDGGLMSVNVSEKIFSLTNDIVSRATFGEKFKEKHELLPLIHEIVVLLASFDVAYLFPSKKFLHAISGIKPRLEKMHLKFDGILDGIIKDHKKNKAGANKGESDEDLVDVLLRVQEDGNLDVPITTDNIKAVILDILLAGSDTSSTVVEWAMSELMRNPREMEMVQTEVRQVFNGKLHVCETEIHKLKYLKLVIKETLRLHPPAPLLPRECREKCEIDGYDIPKKTQVIMNTWAIGRDPEHWRNAETFEPERFNSGDVDYKGTNFEFIPFGAGRRICPGIMFGIANVELPLAQLLYHFDWNLPGGAKPEELDMTEKFGAVVKRKNDLYLIPTLHNNLPVKKNA